MWGVGVKLVMVVVGLSMAGTQPSGLDALRGKAEQGDAAAQNDLGVYYTNGNGVAKNEAVAAKWYRKAADQGYATAQNNLGVFFDKKPGLVLAANGFVDNASAVAAGFVPWSKVTDVQTFQVARQEMLIVMVGDPERYMRRGNALKQAINRANFKLCGSPIAISSNALKIGFDELSSLFKSYWSKYGHADQHAQACGPDNTCNEQPT
ncbi:MAG TPA: tetratricopeptide repeat protein [Dokdonella sp.]|uniref:tetratricopeptide repeat protein n=1 Tax=Dokdonella sp. TaxID=2291710 RepID=UPI002D7EB6AB|nr:tetratricopeptide repeat protein [Dokdonella sp.]HET9031575.1 tetratricopeptide repeat protein [Dokdonella sp.]